MFFVIDDQVAAPDTVYNATILRLAFDHKQSTKDRNIWEKVWKMWAHIGRHHLNDGDFFFKIDDDSFFSAVNFRGTAVVNVVGLLCALFDMPCTADHTEHALSLHTAFTA